MLFKMEEAMVWVAVGLAKGWSFWRIWAKLGLSFRQQIGVFRAALAFMKLHGKKCQLLAAPGGCRGRHHRVLIEIESAADGAKQAGVVEMPVKPRVNRTRCRHEST